MISNTTHPTSVLEDPRSEPLERFLGAPMDVGRFLSLAIGIAVALGKVHQRGFIHKDIRPGNILLNSASGELHLTGFGGASRLLRERKSPDPPESIAGTLPYMAPEQTGRMNRSIDSRSDLYSLGITYYQMLTGRLPFTASDPMEWVHSHIARKALAPSELSKTVPAPITAIVMRLLAKSPEERYQTAAGVESDLQRCLAAWQTQAHIDEFPLGEYDVPDRLLIPEKLYGRSRETELLLASFDRVVRRGTPELVLVSGYSGVGKSSFVHELHEVIVPPRGLFASGKFDQYKRDIPYAALAQAFQSLVRPLLGRNATDLEIWRSAFSEALGPNGLLMVDLIPELKLIVGEQPPVPELSPQDAQSRFHMVFRRFIGVFARAEHPLALFLDDLQWPDAATLDLLEDLLTRADLRHLLLIAAYRDNEVGPSHPLTRKLEAIRSAGASMQEIRLAPLSIKDFEQLLGDCLHCKTERVAALAQLIHAKTAGNPFFAIQFVTALAEERILTFDRSERRWSWDPNRIHAKGCGDSVTDLVVEKLNRLSGESREALQRLACIGNSADIAVLSIVLETSEDEAHANLWEALRLGLVSRSEGSYMFVHDRVREAVYGLLPEKSRAEVHLRIGRLLNENIPLEKREETIFEIVSQLNRGAALVSSREEREQIAELNLLAGKRAKSSTVYASALTFLIAGEELLAQDRRERSHDLLFQLELNRAECEFLSGDPTSAAERLSILSTRAVGRPDQAAVTCLRMALYTTINQPVHSIEIGLKFLRAGGLEWSLHPTNEAVGTELARMMQLLGERAIEALIDLRRMDDPECLATVAVLAEMTGPSFFADHNLFSLVILHIANLSVAHGNCDVSPLAYALLNIVLGVDLGDYQSGIRFGQLGCDLVDNRRLDRFKARVYITFGTWCVPWAKPLALGQPVLRKAINLAHSAGDLTFEGYGRLGLMANMMSAGLPLADAQQEAEDGLAFARKARFGLVADCFLEVLLLIRELRGLPIADGLFEEPWQDRIWFEQHLREGGASLAAASVRYWTHRLQACFFADANDGAIAAAGKASDFLWSARAYQTLAEYHFYSALALACNTDAVPIEQLQRQVGEIEAHRWEIANWAKGYPPNYAHKAALIAAEVARLESRELHAERLYEEAIRLARDNGFIQDEALAHERAAGFYAARGFETISNAYLQNARSCYIRWGADGKVRLMDLKHPQIVPHPVQVASEPVLGTSVGQLDLATVVKVSQAVSGEIEFHRVIEILMETALAHAGAERGLLILPRGAEMSIEAEAITAEASVVVRRLKKPITPSVLPESVFHLVMRTKDSVLVDDATGQEPFSADDYVRRNNSRSLLCLPLMRQGVLGGLLYLENTLTSHAFTPERTALLEVLASQAAISLENTRLYSDLQEREAKVRGLQTELAHANRVETMGQLSASIAHEIKQPVAAMVTNAQAALRWLAEPLDTQEAREALARIVRDGDRAANVVGRIRALFKKAPPRRDDLEINDAIQEVIALIHGEVVKGRVSLRSQLVEGLPLVQGDRVQLQQVVLNLIINAVEAMSGIGEDLRELVITTATAGSGHVLVTVQDSGPGLSSTGLEQVFDAFYSTKPGGLGIGLSICRSIIEAHGGRLWASANVPRGASFHFTLPVWSSTTPPSAIIPTRSL